MNRPAIVLLALIGAAPAAAQPPSGKTVFDERCSRCHNGAADSRAPAPEALRALAPQAILESLTNGAMRVQGARMTGADSETPCKEEPSRPQGRRAEARPS